MSEMAYYGKAISDDKMMEIFPSLVPSDGDWADFEKSLLNTVNMDWNGLKSIFMKRANHSNSKPATTFNDSSVFQTSGVSKETNTPWHKNEEILKVMNILEHNFDILICLKCRIFGHSTGNHKSFEATRPKRV